MQGKRFFSLSVLLLTLTLGLGLTPPWAADYPARPITLINPYPPGGFLDVPGRSFAAVAEKMLGKPVVVVNKAGAAGMIGSVAGAQAPADGYTLTLGCTTITCAVE